MRKIKKVIEPINEKLVIKGEILMAKLKEGGEINSLEASTLAEYLVEINSKTKIKKNTFVSDYKRIFQGDYRSISNKLRDEKGKKIHLRNNKYKVVSDTPSEFMSSQFVALFKFKFKINKSTTVTKVVPGYSPLLISNEYKDEASLIKLVYGKALAQFLTQIGWSDGSGSAQRRLNVEVVDTFWITYMDYASMINYDIAQATSMPEAY